MLLKHLTDPESPAYRLVFIYRPSDDGSEISKRFIVRYCSFPV